MGICWYSQEQLQDQNCNTVRASRCSLGSSQATGHCVPSRPISAQMVLHYVVFCAFLTSTLLQPGGATTIELTLDSPDGLQYLLDGYLAHEEFFSALLQLLGNKVKSATENFLAYSKRDIGQLLPNINAKEYATLQLIHTLATKDSVHANLLLQLYTNASSNDLFSDGYSASPVIGELLRSSMSYPPDKMYQVASSIANRRRYGFNDIPAMVAEGMLSLMNKSAVFVEASKEGDIEVMKMFLQWATEQDLSTALDLTWRRELSEIVRMLIDSNATMKVSDIMKKRNSHNETILHFAAESKSTRYVRILLEDDAPVNCLDKNGHSPLHRAVLNNNMEAAQMLLKKGALVNSETTSGQIPLHVAANNGNLEFVKLLLESGSVVDKGDKYGVTPLLVSEKKTIIGIMKYLFKKDIIKTEENNRNLALLYFLSNDRDEESFSEEVDLELVNIFNYSRIVNCLIMRGGVPFIDEYIKTRLLKITIENGINLLPQSLLNVGALLKPETNETKEMFFTVIRLGNQELTKLMLNEGVPARATRDDGTSALHVASIAGNVDAFFLLLKRGADVNSVTHTGYSMLHAACEGGEVAIVRSLLEEGLKVNLKDSVDNTPLFVAAKHGHFFVIKYLIDKGADTKTVNREKQVPLHAAAIGGNIRVINLLLDRGGDIEAKAKRGETPLFEAVQNGKLSAVKTLLDRGADMGTNNTSGFTLLDIAIYRNNLEVMRLLLERGMNPNNKNRLGWSPLHMAVANVRLEAAKLLLGRGVFVEAQGKSGETALHLAVTSGSAEMVQLLLQRRHKVNIRNKNGQTPLDVAIEKCEKRMIGMLIENGGSASSPVDPKCL